MRSSAWVAGGYVFSQCFRLASNIILTYLLVRKIFGIIATVNIFMTALQMFSDIGIDAAIVQRHRGEEARYQNTAWTIQVIRGVVLWLVACALAYPASLLWGTEIVYVLPVAGLAAVFAGLQSTSLYVLKRRVRLGAITVLGLGTDVASKIVIVVYALISPTVWALVAGALFGAALKAGISHLLDRNLHNRFTWDRVAALDIYRFGRWITISSIITFAAGNTEKLAFAPLFGNAAFGVFWIAVMLAEMGPLLMRRLGEQVGFPALADLYRRDFDRFRYRFKHARLALIIPTHLGVILIILLGGPLVTLVYSHRYAAAAWILPIVAFNSIAGVVNTTYGNAFMAIGKTSRIMIGGAGQVVAIAVTTSIGYSLAGERGFIIAFACVQSVLYPLYAVMAAREKIWQPMVDLPALGLSSFFAIYLLAT